MVIIGLRQCLKKNFNMESLHKVGDVVTIKNKYDEGYSPEDYPCTFIPFMIGLFGGKKVKIKSVYRISPNIANVKLCTEMYYYIIENDEYGCLWTDPMFEECEL